MKTATPDLCRAALFCIPANLPRDEWARVAMALKSEFPDEIGFELFDTWSQNDVDGYALVSTISTWRSVKAGGRVGIGSLFHLAKRHGFTVPKADQPATPVDPEELARLAQHRAEKLKADQAQTEAAHAAAATDAARQWQAASTDGESAYLARKGVQGHGVRYAHGGWLLLPMCDEAGHLWNLQRITPSKPTDGGSEKLFLKGGRKSGLWHLVGTLPPEPKIILLAEGYATAATVHEATGHPVAVAFDAGNLQHVAKALHQRYPAARLVVCGDDDTDTEAKTGRNPGRSKATEAAKAVGGLVVFPEGLPPGATDFNDAHQHIGGAAGLAAVAATIQTAIDAAAHAPAHAPGGAPKNAPSKTEGQRAKSATSHASISAPSADASGPDWDRFTVNEHGVFHAGVDRDGKPTAPEWVCSRLDVEALTRDQDGGGWGYLLNFADPMGRPRQWAMPARMLAGDGGEYRAALLNLGLRIAPSPRARNLLTQYLQTRQPGTFASCTDRIGWHGRAFVLPHETLGDSTERVVFQSESAMENTFKAKGTPEQWMQSVGALCVGNSRLAFAVACAFAGPLLRPAGMESGGFHFRGDSSSGKTTALKVAASVYGGPSYLQRWRTTDNALESIAAQHCDGLLILDELAQVDPKTAGECAYMLANEQSKARATRNGAARARLSWRLLFLSAGELGLADHMQEGQKRARTGQMVRMADIPADAGQGLGAFENLHSLDGGSAFARHITNQAGAVYGATGRAWLVWLTERADTLKSRIRNASEALAERMVPPDASGQVERVGARFALVGAAGELATEAGLTGWPKGESERAAHACFNAWLAARGGIGNGEVSAMLRQVRDFLGRHGDGRFAWWHRANDDHSPKTLNRAGFRRLVSADGVPLRNDPANLPEWGPRAPTPPDSQTEYFVLNEVFKAELCQGFDPQAVAAVLLQHGCLLPDKGRAYDCKPRLPSMGLTRCYRIPAAIFEVDV
jgi:putative DNA primase/helicase